MSFAPPFETPGTVSAAPVLEVEDLAVEIRSGVRPFTVVSGVSFAVYPAQAVAIVGESGAGKSISIRAILGLLDRRRFHVSGRVAMNGVDLSTLSKRARRQLVTNWTSLVFQDPTRSLNPTMRVGMQIAEAMYKSRGREGSASKAEAKERAVELMRTVGIADPGERFHAYPHTLSGGMRQRIVIAIALSCQPKVIFCDEPTTSLDVTTQAQIMDVLDELRERLSISVVLVTHDLALAASRVDDVLVMYAGRFVERIAANAVAAGATMPYSRALLRAVPGAEVGGVIPDPIPGAPPDPRELPGGCAFHPRCAFASDLCARELPQLVEASPGHLVRCFHPSTRDAPAAGGPLPVAP